MVLSCSPDDTQTTRPAIQWKCLRARSYSNPTVQGSPGTSSSALWPLGHPGGFGGPAGPHLELLRRLDGARDQTQIWYMLGMCPGPYTISLPSQISFLSSDLGPTRLDVGEWVTGKQKFAVLSSLFCW